MATKKKASSKSAGAAKPPVEGNIPQPVDEEGRLSVLVEMQAVPGASGMSAMGASLEMAGVIEGFEVDPKFAPVAMSGVGAQAESLGGSPGTYILRGTVKSESDIEQLMNKPGVVAVWKDTPIAGFGGVCPIPPCDCAPGTPKGTIADVANYLGVNQIWAAGHRGTGIVVGVVDSGITAVGRTLAPGEAPARLIPRVIGGWPTGSWGTKSSEWGYHGNMCSTDVLGMAPEARLYDLRVSGAGGSPGTISRALQAFQWAIDQHRIDGTPQVLTNSWGIFQESWDPTYARNAAHPFVRKVEEAMNEGILVLFAAGNCGGTCPDGRCGTDNGPGRSIWGANGHPRVMTVGAVNKNEQFIGYSSQGPAALDPNKPDFCSISHFTGYFTSDNGTSAATPIAAGVVALLKQAKPSATQEQIKQALRDTCKDIGPAGFDQHSGAGIIQAKAAYDRLLRPVTTSPLIDTTPARDLLTLPARDEVTIATLDTAPSRDVITVPSLDTTPSRDVVTTPRLDTSPILDLGTDPRRDFGLTAQSPFVLATPHAAPDWAAYEEGASPDVQALAELEAQIREAEALLEQQQKYLDRLVAQYRAMTGQ